MRKRPMQAVFGLLFVCSLVIVLYPYLPRLLFALNPPNPANLPYATRLSESERGIVTQGRLTEPEKKPVPEGNRLVIPKIGVDIPVSEGSDDRALLRGAWRIPDTATTPTVSNMVLSAHRFRYRPPASETFYLLDQLERGDLLILYWDGQEFDYRVAETREVLPSAVEILAPSENPQLTLFTCTPLFSTAKRLVVVGTPIEE